MLISSVFKLLSDEKKIDTIPGWDYLANEKTTKSGEPWEYVAFSICGYIRSPFDDESLTATATIGQRDGCGRLYQNSLHSRHFLPRKFTVTKENAETQIRVIQMVTLGLNNKSLDRDSIPAKVSSDKGWAAIVDLLKVAKSSDNA